jgi:iron complex transport system substrate-binding protein
LLRISLALSLVIIAAACRPEPSSQTDPLTSHFPAQEGRARFSPLTFSDADGHTLRLARPATRIVSLMPSATETLVALHAAGQLVGRTTYDTASALRQLPLVGGGVDPNTERLVALRPDLVVTWEGERNGRIRSDLEAVGIPVFAIRTEDTTDVFRNIGDLGRLSGQDTAATALRARLRRELAAVAASVAQRWRPSVFYVVWNNPPMTAGPKTFIGQILSLAGGESIFADIADPWPTVGLEDVVRRQPDVVVLPTGEMSRDNVSQLKGLPGWRDLRAIRAGRVVRLPADLLNRPGPQLAVAARALRDALHPDLAQAVK